jgi:hypothetical protein
VLSVNMQAVQMMRALQSAMISDGYEIRWGQPNLGPGAPMMRSARVQPIDPDAAPLEPELTALEAELDSRGYSTALKHFQDAIKHFREQDHTSANSQIRNMIEELFVRLAVDHTTYTDSGKANQGSAAVQALYVAGGPAPRTVGQRLPENDG